MKFYRYMSAGEFHRLMAGETLISDKKHEETNNSTSVGFCFLEEGTTAIRGEQYDNQEVVFDPFEALEFLIGVVTSDFLVEFQPPKTTKLQRTIGGYADPYGGWFDFITVREWCTAEYNRETMNPVAYYRHADFNKRFEIVKRK